MERGERLDPRLLGGRVDVPGPGDTNDVYALPIRGWAIGRDAPVEAIEVVQAGREVAAIPVDHDRADVAEGFPSVEGSLRSGFEGDLASLHLGLWFELELYARIRGGARAPLARISGARKALPELGGHGIQPLTVTTIGRSGSTWLVSLLAHHPVILAFAPSEVDARVATYWMSVLQDMSRPATYREQFQAGNVAEPYWWLGMNAPAVPAHQAPLEQEPVRGWLGRDAVDSLASLCEERIQSFYRQLAPADGPAARYFVEKCLPFQTQPDLLAELYPGSREIVLVRDPRDLLSSVLAFNRKRGFDAFGRAGQASDAEYVRTILQASTLRLLDRWKRKRDDPAVCLVRYEDLILDPEQSLRSLLSFLDLGATEEEAGEILHDANAAAERLSGHRTSADAESSIGRWRTSLTEELKTVCNEVLGPILVELGYADAPEPSLGRA